MTTTPSFLMRRRCIAAMVIVTSMKVLCLPAYRSTDFDVHRNWLALTRHQPLAEWYFDTVNGTTVHTLDYPPSFAYFEYMLSNNVVTEWLLQKEILDSQCLEQRPDNNNDPSYACVVFQRTSVILSDAILVWGAFVASSGCCCCNPPTILFLLVVLNPGLLWLDHVHFQYNGMLLGLLLWSLTMIGQSNMRNVAMGAILYSLLVTMKHLYLPLAPVYLVYLLKHYCFQDDYFHWNRFGMLALVTSTALVLPFVPFITPNQLSQLLSRLFPFGRGLCHDYWAANMWALYQFAHKIMQAVLHISLPDVPPLCAAVALLLAILPGLWCTYQQPTSTKSVLLLHSIVYCSFATFMWAYHVHEKAILTAMVPLTLLATTSVDAARLYLRTCALGLFGLFPLLYQPAELTLKVTSYIAFMALALYLLEQYHAPTLLLTTLDQLGMLVLAGVALFLQVLHPLFLHPWMEFLPLMLTSVTCAIGLVGCWLQSGRLLYRCVATRKQ